MKYTNNIHFKIAFTGMMFSLVLLFQFLERYIPMFGSFMKLNITIVFIMITYYIAGFRWSFLLLILRFVIGPSIDSKGYTGLGMWSHFILFICGIIFICFFIFVEKIINFAMFKVSGMKKDNKNFIKAKSITSFLVVITSTVLFSFLNGILFTPVYFHLMDPSTPVTLEGAKESYTHIKGFFLGMPNYWAGIFVTYGIGNLIKYSLSAFLFISLSKTIKHFERINIKKRI